MGIRRPPLRSLMVFEAVARHQNFRRASQELSISTSAISHQIKALEGFLGIKLFHRLNRGVQLTDEGSLYYLSVRAGIELIDNGTTKLFQIHKKDTLTVRCGISFAIRWLMPRLPIFLSEAPHIGVSILTQTTAVSLSTEIDLEIRYGIVENDSQDMHIEPLLSESIVPMCSPALLRSSQSLADPTDIAHYPLIESEQSIVTWSRWIAINNVNTNALPRLHFDSTYLAIQAAVSGLGMALEGNFLANEELASGRLIIPPTLRDTAIVRPLRYIITPISKMSFDRVAIFREWLIRTANTP